MAHGGGGHGHPSPASAGSVEDGPYERQAGAFAWEPVDHLDPPAGLAKGALDEVGVAEALVVLDGEEQVGEQAGQVLVQAGHGGGEPPAEAGREVGRAPAGDSDRGLSGQLAGPGRSQCTLRLRLPDRLRLRHPRHSDRRPDGPCQRRPRSERGCKRQRRNCNQRTWLQLYTQWFAPRRPYPPQRANTVLSSRPGILRMTSEATLRSHLGRCNLSGRRRNSLCALITGT